MSRPTYLSVERRRIGCWAERDGENAASRFDCIMQRETQERRLEAVVGKWPWAQYRSVFGPDGFIVGFLPAALAGTVAPKVERLESFFAKKPRGIREMRLGRERMRVERSDRGNFYSRYIPVYELRDIIGIATFISSREGVTTAKQLFVLIEHLFFADYFLADALLVFYLILSAITFLSFLFRPFRFLLYFHYALPCKLFANRPCYFYANPRHVRGISSPRLSMIR